LKLLAPAKVNLTLLVGRRRPDGLHEVATVLQRIHLADELEFEPASRLAVDGFGDDTLVGDALRRLARDAGMEPAWRVRIDKRIPVAAGLGGGSADAGVALAAANARLDDPLPRERLQRLAASIGADVPFFLEPGPKLAEGAGERLTPLPGLPLDYWIVLALPHEAEKRGTADVYARFDVLGRSTGFEDRRARLRAALARCREPRDLAALPPNDLAEAAGRSQLVDELLAAGAFRADVSGAGPAVYALFEELRTAERAAGAIEVAADVWVTRPVW
jgi:4-diphosphocytidyl-2-C-methyl-D-erythritol kinase